jgi:hypothetical protein
MYTIIILNMTFKIFCNSPSNLYSNCHFFSCFPVFPYAHKKFSKSKQLAESIDDICNNIWNKKKQRPENLQTGDKQRPENDQTGDKQRPENDQKGDTQRLEDGHLQGTIGPQKNQSEAGKSSVSEGVSQAGCQPMFDTCVNFLTVLWIRIRRIRMFLGLLDPDPLVRVTDPASNLLKQK